MMLEARQKISAPVYQQVGLRGTAEMGPSYDGANLRSTRQSDLLTTARDAPNRHQETEIECATDRLYEQHVVCNRRLKSPPNPAIDGSGGPR